MRRNESRNNACWAWGGNLNKEFESRQELSIEKYIAVGLLNNEFLFGRESCEWRNLLQLCLNLESWQELFSREANGKIIACWALKGKLKQ